VIDAQQQFFLGSRVRAMQIIIAAMAIGVLVFLVVAHFVHAKVGTIDKTHELDLITHIALAYGVAALIGGPILAGALVRFGRRRLAKVGGPATHRAGKASGFENKGLDGHANQLISLLVSKTIICGAIFEGAALFLGVGYLLNRSILTAACSVIMVVALLMQMPSRDRAQRWLEEQARQIAQEGSSGQ